MNGILFYSLPSNGSSAITLYVVDPMSHDIVASHDFPASFLGVDFTKYGHARPGANRQFSSDLTMTISYVDATNGSRQLNVIDEGGRVVEVSTILSQADSFSGARSASGAFFREGRLYFSMADSTSATQYTVSEDAIKRGELSSDDFSESDVDRSDDGVSGSNIGGNLDSTCLHNGSRSWNAGLGYLENGRWVGVAFHPDGLAMGSSTILSFANGCHGHTTSDGGTTLLPATNQYVGQAVVSPDGKSIAFIALQNEVAKLYTVPQEGGAPTEITTLPGVRTMLAGWR